MNSLILFYSLKDIILAMKSTLVHSNNRNSSINNNLNLTLNLISIVQNFALEELVELLEKLSLYPCELEMKDLEE
jgi:hypothetical protein